MGSLEEGESALRFDDGLVSRSLGSGNLVLTRLSSSLHLYVCHGTWDVKAERYSKMITVFQSVLR